MFFFKSGAQVIYIYINTTTVSFSHALQNVCLQNQRTHTYNFLSGPRLSVPSPNRQEQRAPQYPLRPHPPNRMSPRLGYFKRGKPPSDSLQSCNVVSLISQPREIDPRHQKKEKLNLSACPSSWLHSFKLGLKGGRGRAFEPKATWNIQLFRV